MISRLTGQMISKSPTEIVLDTGGIGYQVFIPLSTFEGLPESPAIVTLLTHLHVREDAMVLYGFLTETERELFRMLLTVSGIGPRMALGILSGITPAELQSAVLGGDINALTSISGVGRKTAERIILELKSRIGRAEILPESVAETPTTIQLKQRMEALVALMSLGYTRTSAEKALRIVLNDPSAKNCTTEELIKRSLHHASRT